MNSKEPRKRPLDLRKWHIRFFYWIMWNTKLCGAPFNGTLKHHKNGIRSFHRITLSWKILNLLFMDFVEDYWKVLYIYIAVVVLFRYGRFASLKIQKNRNNTIKAFCSCCYDCKSFEWVFHAKHSCSGSAQAISMLDGCNIKSSKLDFV